MEVMFSVWLLITLFKQFIQDKSGDYLLTTNFVYVARLGDFWHILTGLLCDYPELGNVVDF